MAKPIVTSTGQFTYSDPKHEAEIQEVTQNRSIIFESLVRKNGSSQKLPGGFDLERLPEGSRVDQNGVRFKSICLCCSVLCSARNATRHGVESD